VTATYICCATAYAFLQELARASKVADVMFQGAEFVSRKVMPVAYVFVDKGTLKCYTRRSD
jgi:hypothetical protein